MTLQERLLELYRATARRAARLLPREVLFWALIRTGVEFIRSDEEVPAVPFTTVLDRLGRTIR